MKLIKEIRSKEGKLHFKRWRLLKTPWFEIYIHGIFHRDEDEHLHNHPWNICTIILRGSYIEKLMSEDCKTVDYKFRNFLNIGYRNSKRFHSIDTLLTKRVYTLAIVGKRKSQEWGYYTEKGFVDHITYRKDKKKRD